MDKMLLWGALPWENDGGAVVTYYQLTEMFYRNPKFDFNVIPKVWEQAKQNDLSFAKWYKVKTDFFGQIPKVIPQIMKENDIKLLVLWHIPWEYFPIIDSVHKIGGQVWNWQTIHWENDVLFFSDKLKDFDHWVPATQYAEDMLAKIGGVDKSKMTMIPHGVPTYKFYPHEYGSLKNYYGIKPEQKLILFVGRCQLSKGVVPLMLAARKLCDEFNCHIMFKAGVHDGVWKAREIGMLLNMMTKWDSRIHFETTWTQPSYMENLMAESDILVCPSGHEGSSLTPLEAMACGRPVAITDIPVHRELLGGNNGVCGLLMPPTDHTEFVNDVQSVKVPSTDIVYGTLKYLLENPDEAKAMGEKGLYRAKELYSLDLVCKKWFDLLEKN